MEGRVEGVILVCAETLKDRHHVVVGEGVHRKNDHRGDMLFDTRSVPIAEWITLRAWCWGSGGGLGGCRSRECWFHCSAPAFGGVPEGGVTTCLAEARSTEPGRGGPAAVCTHPQ